MDTFHGHALGFKDLCNNTEKHNQSSQNNALNHVGAAPTNSWGRTPASFGKMLREVEAKVIQPVALTGHYFW